MRDSDVNETRLEKGDNMDEITETAEPAEVKTFPAEYIASLNHESRKYRLQGREAKVQLRELEQEYGRLETEHTANIAKANEEVAELERKIAAADSDLAIGRAREDVFLAAHSMGFTSPGDAFDQLEDFTADGPGIQKALKKLLRKHPELAEPEPEPPTPGIGGPPIHAPRLTGPQLWLEMLRGGRR